jgi:ketosteroid isomerase-like protein
VPLRHQSTILAALLGAGVSAGLPALQRRAVRALLERNVAALRRGDLGPLLSSYAPDARMVFPGKHSWGREYRGREEIESFLRRFVAARLEGEIADVVVQGPPWRTTLAAQFNDRARDPDGAIVYTNRALIFARIRWGRIVDEEVYEDTQKVADFDDHLAARGELVRA